MDMNVVNDLLAEIGAGNQLTPTRQDDGRFAVWVAYPEGGTSMSAFEDVGLAELTEVTALHPDKVLPFSNDELVGYADVFTSREGFSSDANGSISDAGFHADILGDDD